MYGIRDREAGNVIVDDLATRELAEEFLKEYEFMDKMEGIYEENFYEVFEVE